MMKIDDNDDKDGDDLWLMMMIDGDAGGCVGKQNSSVIANKFLWVLPNFCTCIFYRF